MVRSWLAQTISTRLLTTNNDFLLLFYGRRGCGKSTSAISLALEIDPTFDQSRIVFTIEQLLALINTKSLKRGQVVVFDELGVAANVKEHASQANKAASFLLQTMRPFNLCVIFCTPKKNYIDKQLRPLFDMFIKMTSRKFTNDLAKGRIYWVQDNEDAGEAGRVYRHHPELVIEGRHCDLTTVYFRKPHQDIEKQYKERRKEYVYSISEEQSNIIVNKKEYLRRESAKSIAEEILSSKQQMNKFKKYWRNAPEGAPRFRFDQDLISAEKGIGSGTAYKVKKYLESRMRKS